MVDFYKNPPLASVDINSEKLGMYATKLLIDKLESRESKGYYVVETNLIERESLVKKRWCKVNATDCTN